MLISQTRGSRLLVQGEVERNSQEETGAREKEKGKRRAEGRRGEKQETEAGQWILRSRLSLLVLAHLAQH